MKKQLNGCGSTFIKTAGALLFVCAITACNNDKDISLNQPVDAVGAAMNPVSNERSSDTAWVSKAYNMGLEAIGLSEYVEKQLSNPAAKKLAQTIINDHTRINNEMKEIASKKGIPLPQGLAKSETDDFMKEHSQNGPSFDKAYADKLVDSHNVEIDLYTSISQKANDKDIRDFFSRNLGVIQEHLYLSNSVRDSIISKEARQK